MKLNGVALESPPDSVLVIPRGDSELVITIRPVMDFSDFDSLCPQPLPPVKNLPGGERQLNVEDESYKSKVVLYGRQRMAWMVLKSLEPSNIEWDTVKKEDPTTWVNYTDELRKVFTPAEYNALIDKIMTACGLNQSMIEEATERFLASRQVQQQKQ